MTSDSVERRSSVVANESSAGRVPTLAPGPEVGHRDAQVLLFLRGDERSALHDHYVPFAAGERCRAVPKFQWSSRVKPAQDRLVLELASRCGCELATLPACCWISSRCCR